VLDAVMKFAQARLSTEFCQIAGERCRSSGDYFDATHDEYKKEGTPW
jgi:hypothetical protein